MAEKFYQKSDSNLLDNIVIDINKIYEKFPIDKKINPKPNRVNFNSSFFHKIYHNSFLPIKIRNYFWHYFRRTNLDLSWFEEFKSYWSKIIGGRPFWDVKDLFFIKNLYRLRFQESQLPDTNDPNIHLEAWQRPEVIYLLLHSACKESYLNEYPIINIMKKKANKKINSILEFGCGTAPITTSLYEFFKLSKKIKIFISDIQTLTFNYAAYKFRMCSNVIPILLIPEKNFLLNLSENVDVIFCKTVFEHLNKPLDTIKIFYEILNKNGLLLFDYIVTSGEGLDTEHSMRERDQVLNFINDNFKVVYGKITNQKTMNLTVIMKK